MAIAIQQSIATAVDTPAGSATSSSWTPGSNELCLCLIANRGNNTPANFNASVTGNGLTWVKVLEKDDNQNVVNLSVWRAMGASPTSGGVTVNFSVDPTACSFQIVRLSGVDTTGTNGSGAIGATNSAETGATDTTPATTSVTTTRANSRVIGFASGRGQTYTVGSGFTAILINQTANSAGNIVRSNSEYKDVATSGTNTTVDFSLSAVGDWVMAALEILEASANVTVTPANASATSSALAPTVILGSVSATPANASATSSALAPTVKLGNVSVTPPAAIVASSALAPTVVEGGNVSVTPANASAASSALAPTVILGSLTIAPAPALAVGSALVGAILNFVRLTPAAALAASSAIAPTVDITSGNPLTLSSRSRALTVQGGRAQLTVRSI